MSADIKAGLKAAFRALIAAVGGSTNAARLIGGHQPHISAAANPNQPDKFPRIDQVVELERLAGKAPVTEFMAECAGLTCSLKEGEPVAKSLLTHFAAVTKETADVEIRIAELQGKDPSGEQTRQLYTEIRQAKEAMCALEERVRQMLYPQGAKLVSA